MRNLWNIILAAGITLFLVTPAIAETINPQEASSYVGSAEVVEGVVSQVSTSGGGTTFINFGGRYPNHVFYAVIFKKHAHFFPNIYSLQGKAVAISGTVELYKGKPQIIVTNPDQIELR